MKNRVEYFLFFSFGKIFQLLGLKVSRRIAPILAFIFYYFIPIRKKTVLGNLKQAFPEYVSSKIKSIAINNYKSFAITLIEILCLPKLNKDQIKEIVDIKNAECALEKYKEDKGIILLTAHFGNWEYLAIAIALGIYLDIPMSAVAKRLRNNLVSEWMNNVRTKFKIEVVPLGISIRRTYQALKDNKVVVMVADQRGPQEGIRIELFGTKVSVFSGPAVLALKTGAPILFIVAVRQKDFSYSAYFHEISTDNLPEEDDEKIIELSRRHMSQLEQYIRGNPEQWLWMHKRWKY